jgi:tetratricopeptide (TPR) repeat protein
MYIPAVPRKVCLLLVLASNAASGGITPTTADSLRKSDDLIDEQRYEEAIALLESDRIRSVRENDEYSEALILNQLGLVYARQGKSFAAQNAFDNSLLLLTRIKGKDAPDLIHPLNNLANLLYDSNQCSQAEALVRRSLGILTSLGQPDLGTGGELAMLAKIYLGESKVSLAQQSAEESLRVLSQRGHAEDVPASIAWSVLGAVYENEGAPANAEDSLNHALSILQKQLSPEDYRLAEASANLGLLYAHEGAREKAEPLLEQAHACFRANALNTYFVRGFLLGWADLERKAGHKKEAKDLMSEAKVLIKATSEGSMSRYVVDANALRQLPAVSQP